MTPSYATKAITEIIKQVDEKNAAEWKKVQTPGSGTWPAYPEALIANWKIGMAEIIKVIVDQINAHEKCFKGIEK